MAVFKIGKKQNYTVMSNYHLRDKNLSLKAKGLLSFMLSLPEDWDYSLSGLVSVLKEGESAINATLKELKENGYIRIDKLLPNQTESKKIEYIYNIYEQPMEYQDIEEQTVEKQEVENQGVENQHVENQGQINTKENNICPLADNFHKLWNSYPRRDGKSQAFKHYKSWIRGKEYAGKIEKLTNKEMWYAIKIYQYLLEESKTEKQFVKMGSTFFNDSIYEYAEKYKQSPNYWENKLKQGVDDYGVT